MRFFTLDGVMENAAMNSKDTPSESKVPGVKYGTPDEEEIQRRLTPLQLPGNTQERYRTAIR